MDGGLIITLTSVAMFVGCFVLGLVPILFRLSEVSSVLIFPLFFLASVSVSQTVLLL